MEKLKELADLARAYPFLVIGAILFVLGAIGFLPLGTTNESRSYAIQDRWRLALVIVGLAGIVFDAVRLWRERSVPQSLTGVSGTIRQPLAHTNVTRAFLAAGSAQGMKRGHHLWLIVEVGTHKWPKGDELQVRDDGTWQADVYEDGTGASFSLSLYVADGSGHNKILHWLDIGTLIGYHPFEVDIPGTRRLSRMDDLHKQP